MNGLFVILCFLALGAWITYALRERSGLRLLVALGYGAVLGMVVIIAATVIVDINPARLAWLGLVFSVLVAALVLSAVVRLGMAAFSRTSRASVAAHEVIHALWFGAAISICAFTYLYQVNLRSFLATSNPWTIRGLQRPRAHGRDLAEWLPVLRTDTDRTQDPLRIVRVIPDDEPECDAVEIALSWDLMETNDLIHAEPLDEGGRQVAHFRSAQLHLSINGGAVTDPLCWRADNGNCLLRYHHRYLNLGTNELKVRFNLYAGDSRLSATGPPTKLEFNTRGLVPVMKNSKWEKLGLAMDMLRDLRPKWRTKDIESGFIREWDPNSWNRFCLLYVYRSYEWVEIDVTSAEQDAAVLKALQNLHVPGEKTEHGYRVLGYAPAGKAVADLE